MIQRIAVAVWVGFFSLGSGAQSFTLEQVLSAPFSSALQASPKGGRFLWIANQQGKRNIWVAEASGSTYTVHRVTNDDADDGVDLGDIAWTPDGEQIIYARGGDYEFPGEAAANPAMLPAGLEEDIWIVGVHGGDARKLAEGQAPAISPDGATMAYLDKDQIWTLALKDAAAKPAQLFHGRGKLGSLAWSPDGKYLAFTSERGDHGFVGVFSFADQTLKYLDPSTEIDREPVWSPDSRQIAFVRIPPDTSGIDFKPRRSAQPWSIRVADVKTGEGHPVWHAHEGQGSVFHGTESEQQLFWTAGGHVVFPWESSGWVHLYSVAVPPAPTSKNTLARDDAVELTPGEFEVDYVAFGKDRRTLVYSSNQDDIDRRHLWEVSADGGSTPQGANGGHRGDPVSPHALTHGEGLEMIPAMGPDGTVAVLRSDVHVPIRPAVVGAGGELKDLAPQLVPADFPGAKLITPQQVIFSAADGMKIHGQLFVPASAEDGKKHPALVFFHGGSRRQMLLGWHYMDYYSNAYGMNQYLASLGYVVLSVNYRSGIGYGLNFREALNYGAAGASEFNDVQGAGLYLRSRADVDGAKIGVWGGSYGGYLTALALSRASDMFAAGVDFHGVHDWNLELQNWQPKYNPDSDQQAERLAWESSPLASVKTWRSPVLLIQGDDDRNVQFSQTVRLAAALRAQGTPFEEHVFPDEIHGFLLERSWITAYGLTADFFNRHLKGE